MFLKSYKLRNNAPIKSSDTKRLHQRIELAFPLLKPEEIQTLLPPKCVTVLKLITHSGFHTNVFCANKVVMFFEVEMDNDRLLVPTLYALWIVPEMLPYFTTHKNVLPHLSNGSDLMLPGVVPQNVGMNMYGRYQKNQLVAINLTSNKAAMAVGYLTRSSYDLYMSGGRGSAIKILHIFGDKLWCHEAAMTRQPPNWKPVDLTSSDFPALGANYEHANNTPKNDSLETLVNFVSADANNVEICHQIASIEKIYINKDKEYKGDTNVEDEKKEMIDSIANVLIKKEKRNELSAEEILKIAFLAALKNYGKTLQLPLLTSNFYRLHVVPEITTPIELKKTKYKKLSNFLAEMVNEGFIVVREETKGIDKITKVNLDHPEVINFIMDFKPPQSGRNDVDSIVQPLFRSELTELYIVTNTTAAFFTKFGYKRGEGIPSIQIKKIIREYISKQNLPIVNLLTKTIKLDDILQPICGCEEATLSVIFNNIMLKMDHSYQMVTLKDVPSNKPLIEMSISRRSGNKKVTLVTNLECYGIIVSEFIKLCKQGAAASTTIVKLPNQKHEQLQIQGNQIRFLHNLLTETYKIPAKYILGLHLASKEKKHKK